MLRKALISLLLLGSVVPALAGAATPVRGQTLMPGVVYSRQVEFTSHGPVVMHVTSAPRPTGLYTLRTLLSNDAVLGTERLSSIERRYSDQGTIVAVNAGAAGVMRGGVLDTAPAENRSTVGVDTDGTLHVDRVDLEGTWQGSGQRRLLGINEQPRGNRTTLYTRAWGGRTPAESGGAYAVLQPFPATTPNGALTATVTGYLPGGNQSIPADGAVLAARGSQAGFLTAEAPVGSKVTIVLTLTPPWTNVPDAVGGGPLIVRNGKPVYRAFENFTTDQLAFRNGRSGVGQTADGRIVFAVADGRQPGYSTGLTNFELALAMMRLGCVSAYALGSGATSALAFDGKLLNRPSRRGEPAVVSALALFYSGVYAPALASREFSRSGNVSLAYKLVRPSTVTAQVVGPGGATAAVDSGAKGPGTYRLSWPASGQAAGPWTFRVVADDDKGQRSTAERDFTLK